MSDDVLRPFGGPDTRDLFRECRLLTNLEAERLLIAGPMRWDVFADRREPQVEVGGKWHTIGRVDLAKQVPTGRVWPRATQLEEVRAWAVKSIRWGAYVWEYRANGSRWFMVVDCLTDG